MSTRNSEKTLSESIESILSQTYKDFEFLIVDDASNDNSSKIIKKYVDLDQRIKHFTNLHNIGLTKSLNSLIDKSRYKYIARQDSDDLSENTRFEKQIALLENSNYKICTTRAKIIDKNILIPNLSYYLPHKYSIKFKNPFIHGTLMIQKKLLIEIGKYDESFYYAQDYKLFIDLIKNGEKVKMIKEPLYQLNMSNNISSTNKYQQKKYAKKARTYL